MCYCDYIQPKSTVSLIPKMRTFQIRIYFLMRTYINALF